MKKRSKTIVFFGSGPVAAESLKLLQKHQSVSAVVTKPATQEMMRKAAPDMPIYVVSKRSELDELVDSNILANEVGVLIDFGIIVSQKAIDYFDHGIINSHFSLLPQWRGADPITFSLLSGQAETGVSLMLLSAGMDEGPILTQSILPIEKKVTNEILTEQLIELSDSLLQATLDEYLTSNIAPLEQKEAAQLLGLDFRPTYSRKLTKEDGQIDWRKSAEEIEREIRAFHIWPRSYTTLHGYDVIIREAELSNQSGTPGEYFFTKKSLTIFCGKNSLNILKIQPSGKKEMPIQAFLAGYKI